MIGIRFRCAFPFHHTPKLPTVPTLIPTSKHTNALQPGGMRPFEYCDTKRVQSLTSALKGALQEVGSDGHRSSTFRPPPQSILL